MYAYTYTYKAFECNQHAGHVVRAEAARRLGRAGRQNKTKTWAA